LVNHSFHRTQIGFNVALHRSQALKGGAILGLDRARAFTVFAIEKKASAADGST
jgi:hypothetical protein